MFYLFILSYSINLQIYIIQRTCLFDVNTIDAVEGIDDGLAAISVDGIAHTLGYYLNRHAGFEADSVAVPRAFHGYLK